jgi:Uma2 family endonuclease
VFDDESVELLDGVIVQMPPPHGPEHDGTIHVLAKLLLQALGDRAEVRIQSSFAAGERSEPEPDIAVVPPGDYRDAHPSVALLIVEVADSSVVRDRTAKAELYALAGVSEYWVVDLVHRVVEVRTEPASDAGYRALVTRRRGETLTLSSLPDVSIAVSDVLR